MRNKLKSLLVFAVVLLPGITGLSVCFISNGNPIKADLRYLLPDSGRNPADRTADFYTDRLSRELIFLAETGDEDRDNSREEASVSSDSQFSSNEDAAAQKSAAYLTEKLSELPFITLRNSPEMMSRGRFLFEHRYALGADYFMKDGAVDEESLREEVLNVLYEPFSGVTEKEIKADPFFTMRHYLKNGGGFTLDEKGLLKLHTQSGKSAYLVSAFINREHLNRDEKQKLNALARDFASS
jgi:predicted exporter